jgi:5-methylcytosine-specific restriction protein A
VSTPLAPVPRYCNAYPCPNGVTEGRYCEAHRPQARRFDKPSITRTPGVHYGRRWQKARLRFLAIHPFCIDCGSADDLQVDHQVPHRGDADLFWDQGNWRTRCLVCHARKTAAGQ